MAESDEKVDRLEEDLKMLKTEVQRTLVDLRAIVMQEDAPLSERFTAGPSPETEVKSSEEGVPEPRGESAASPEADAAAEPDNRAEGEETMGTAAPESDNSPDDVAVELRYVKEELRSLQRADALENELSAVRDELRLLRRDRDSGKGYKARIW